VKAGKIPGIYCRDVERAQAMTKRGFKFITIGHDVGIIRDGVAGMAKALKG
jgi:2-keto-3-deoxy-L-rhamnonate aldolase RhmA